MCLAPYRIAFIPTASVYHFLIAGLTAASDDFVVGYINQSYHIEYLSQLAYRLPYFCVIVF